MSLADCQIIKLPKITDPRGNLSFVEGGVGRHIPFEIKRIYYLYDVTGDRGSHAHKNLRQLILAVHGSFDVELDDGAAKKSIHLSRPDEGLFLCPMIWRNLTHFSPGAVCLVLASEFYQVSDYIRDYDEFLTTAAELAGVRQRGQS